MMPFGLTANDLDEIIASLDKYPEVQEALIFGSRAMGNYHPGSDVDIVLKGSQISYTTVNRISYELNEETNLPFTFDIINYHSISEKALIDHIDRIAISFYHQKKLV
jgi:predicted nucleotidyltransferase